MHGIEFGFGAIEQEFWRMVFLMTRIGAALVPAPLFGAAGVPAQARVALAGAVAVLLCNWTSVSAPADLASLPGLLAVAGEVLVGLSLGFVLQLAMAAPVVGAELVGGAMAMTMASTVDPASGASSPALAQYFTVVTTLVFLGTGAHLSFLNLVIESYRAFPPGDTWLGAERFALVASFAALMLKSAVLIALPAGLVLLVVQFVTGIVSRSAPALNLFSLGLPAGVFAGIVALVVSSSVLAEQIGELVGMAIDGAASVIAR